MDYVLNCGVYAPHFVFMKYLKNVGFFSFNLYELKTKCLLIQPTRLELLHKDLKYSLRVRHLKAGFSANDNGCSLKLNDVPHALGWPLKLKINAHL